MQDDDIPDHRPTAEELSFLLRDLAERERRADRNERANRNRTERRRSDPDYAARLRAGDRERQRRRRAKDAIGRPDAAEPPPAALPDLSFDEALRRLEAYLQGAATASAAQLRSRPERLRQLARGFVAYRVLAAGGSRPTRGALAAVMRSRFALALTPPQIQKLRDQIERLAAPGGPWHPGRREV
ncbi:hypothetical protein DEW08_11120 [Azospirillum thermophilum]|uniref:Uncharacterized protein n=2 Tax=Azospirillum thermophilum TaxID=2202148 RepID=A0A2S2CUC3_9PROT|nr:hypothetical protein DEW08_11120 [Azospirillum thermophilum]